MVIGKNTVIKKAMNMRMQKHSDIKGYDEVEYLK